METLCGSFDESPAAIHRTRICSSGQPWMDVMDQWAPEIAAVAFALYAGILAWIAVSDLRSFRIPNAANALLFLLFFPVALLLPQEVNWLQHGGAALLIFAVMVAAWCLGWMGAGDVKMFTALALWAGLPYLMTMMFTIALAGGLLAVLVVLLKHMAPRFCPTITDVSTEVVWPKFLNNRPKMPYGAAISFGALLAGFHAPLFAPLFGPLFPPPLALLLRPLFELFTG